MKSWDPMIPCDLSVFFYIQRFYHIMIFINCSYIGGSMILLDRKETEFEEDSNVKSLKRQKHNHKIKPSGAYDVMFRNCHLIRALNVVQMCRQRVIS